MGRWRAPQARDGGADGATDDQAHGSDRTRAAQGNVVAEVLLWRELKQSDLKFRKQHPIGRYVVDFYCAAAKLSIEIDGIAHDMGDQPQRDLSRDAFLKERGLEVARIAAAEVLKSPAETAAALVALCNERCAKPLHHPAGGPPPHPATPDREDGRSSP